MWEERRVGCEDIRGVGWMGYGKMRVDESGD